MGKTYNQTHSVYIGQQQAERGMLLRSDEMDDEKQVIMEILF